MPFHDLLEYGLPILFQHITMTRNQAFKIPAIDSSDTFAKGIPVFRSRPVPNQPSLCRSFTTRVRQWGKDLGKETSVWVDPRFAVLLMCREVEQKVCLYQRLGWLVIEDDLLVGTRMDVFVFKLGVKLNDRLSSKSA